MTIEQMMQYKMKGKPSNQSNSMTAAEMLSYKTKEKVKIGILDFLNAPAQGISKFFGSAPALLGDILTLTANTVSGKGKSTDEMFEELNRGQPKLWSQFITDRINPMNVIKAPERIIRKAIVGFFEKTDIDERLADYGTRLSKSNKIFIETGFPKQETKALQFIEDIGAGSMSLASALGIGAIFGSAAAGIVFSGVAKVSGYQEALSVGKSYEEAATISDLLGIFEGGLEFWGIHSIIRSGGGIIKRGIKGAVTEFIQEFSQTGSEGTIKTLSGVDKQEFSQIIQNALYAGAIGAVLGGASAISVASIQKNRIKSSLLRAELSETDAAQKTNELMNNASEEILNATNELIKTAYETRVKENAITIKALSGQELTPEETDILNTIYKRFVNEGLIEKKIEPKAEGEYVYHGTSEGAARNIQKQGIKSGMTSIGDKSYFSDTEQYAQTYADRKSTSNVLLRIKKTKDLLPDTRIVEKGDFFTSKSISPKDIEIKMPNGEWIPITEYDFYEKIQLFQPKGEVVNKAQQIVEANIKEAKEPKDIQKKIDLLYQGREKQLDQRRLAIEREMSLLEKQKRTKTIQNKLDKLSEELESIHFQIADLEETGITRLEKEGITLKGEELERLRRKAFRQGEITLRKDLMAKIKARREEKARRAKAIKKIIKQPKKPENIVDVKYQKQIDAILNELGEKKQIRKRSLAVMTTNELIKLADTIADLKETGKKVFKSKKEQSKMAAEIMNAVLIKQAGGTRSGMFAKGSVEEQKAKRASGIKKADINFLRPLRMVKRLFGQVGEELLYDSFDSASTIKNINLLGRKSEIEKLRKKNKITSWTLGDTITLDGQTFSINNILRMYLATKDEQSYKALLFGNNISKEQVDNFINEVKERYPKYITFADEVQKIVGDRYDAIAKVMADIFNVEVEKVKVYFPLIRKAFNQLETLNEGIESEFIFEQVERKGAGFSYTSANKDFTISRETMKDQFQTEISLNFMGDAFRAIEKQEHLIAYAPLHKAFNKILGNKDIQDAVTYNHSDAAWRWLNDYLKVNINPDCMYKGADLSKGIVRRVRLGLSKAYLGFNVVTAAKQFPSAVLALKYTTPQDIAISMLKIAVSKKARNKVYELDPSLRNRVVSRDYQDLLAEIHKLPASDIKRALLIASKSIDKAAFTMIMQMDKYAVLSVYDAVYRHQKRTKSEAEAKNIAHKAVIETQPQGGVKDLPQIYRTNNEFMRMTLMFTNQLNQIWNMIRADTVEEISKRQYAKTTTGIASVMLSSTLIYLMSHGRLPEDPDDFIEAIFGTFIASMPIIGNYGMAYFRGFEASVSPAEAILKNIDYTIKNIKSGEAIKAMEKSLFLLAVVAQMPYSQIRRTIKGATDLTTGRTDDLRRLIWSEYVLENQ